MAQAKTLVIVESPAKARTIGKYLGANYIVRASMGHVKDLPKNKLGVDIEKNFEPHFITIKGKEKVLSEIRKAAKEADRVLLATDPDREGEAIGWHIAQVLKKYEKPIARIWLREITRSGLQAALKQPREINLNRVEAQFTRRILDRLVGYQISPILWDKIWRGLSAGRVQSVALRLIVEREREIEAFVPEEYWRIRVQLHDGSHPPFWARLVRKNGKKLRIPDETTARSIEEELANAVFIVDSVKKKRRKKAPPPPFITATLQQEAARRFRWPARRTMEIAQRLYEGVDLPEGRTGLITYMRTDSVRVSEEAIGSARNLIKSMFGDEALNPKIRKFRTGKAAQDAHEAIRPTAVTRTPDQLRGVLNDDEFRLYELIWRRFMASQMADAEYDVTTVVIRAGDYEFEVRGEILVKTGFLAVYQSPENGAKSETAETSDEEKAPSGQLLPPLKKDQHLHKQQIETTQHFTQPPPRYTEASLIRELEKRGIGRPSTYATILSVIQNRDYVVKNGATFHPTALGRLVCQLLEEFFPDLMDYQYTARMEAALDKIEQGKTNRVRLLTRFYRSFSKELEKARNGMPSYKAGVRLENPCPKCGETALILRWSRNGGFVYCEQDTCDFKIDYEHWLQPPDPNAVEGPESCPRCGSPMNVQHGRHGMYAACEKCGLTIAIDDRWPLIRTDRTCPEGHQPLVLKKGPYGPYYSCIRDDCKGTRPVYLDLPCLQPDCNGEIVLRTFRRGRIFRTFYGCDRYPDCQFSFSGMPVREPCPECGAPYQVQTGRTLRCMNPECSRYRPPRRFPRKKAAATKS